MGYGAAVRREVTMVEGIKRTAATGHDLQDWRAADRRLTAILDTLMLGAILIDPAKHRIVYANPEAATMIGSPVEDMVGQVCHQFICPVAVGQCPITDLHQEIDHSERCVLNRAGEKIPILKTVRKENGNVLGLSPEWWQSFSSAVTSSRKAR